MPVIDDNDDGPSISICCNCGFRQEVVVLCLESILADSIDPDYGSSLTSQRRQDIIAGRLCLDSCDPTAAGAEHFMHHHGVVVHDCLLT